MTSCRCVAPGRGRSTRSSRRSRTRSRPRSPIRHARSTSSTGSVCTGASAASLYGFRADSPVPFQPETRISLICRDEDVRGSLVAVEDFDVVVHLCDDLGAEIASARISTSPGFILERLRERLESVALRPQLPSGGVAGATWQPEAATTGRNEQAAIEGAKALETIDDPGLHPNEAQWRAMSTAAGSNLHFVWGPPGTGKTVGLAQTARMLAGLGERVLVLAHANVAVDVAMLRVADAFVGTDELQASRVLRIGDPHHADARGRTEILVETAVARQNPTLARTIGDLEERRRALAASLRTSDDPVEVDNLGAELRHVRQELSELRKGVGRKRPSPSLRRR